jgi:hypothetical protein
VGEQIRRVEGARFLAVWIHAGLNWRGHIAQVGTKMQQLLGVLGRVRADLDERLLLSLYNSMALQSLQYCLWCGETLRQAGMGPLGIPF